MIDFLRKKSADKAGISFCILFAIGTLFMFGFLMELPYFLYGENVFEELTPEEIKPGLYVNINLTDNFGCFMEEYTEYYSTGEQITDYLYYVIWTGDEYATDYRYMAIRVYPEDMERMDTMSDNTYYYIPNEPIKFQGYIREMTSEDESFFKEYFMESGWTEEEYKEGTLPYYIQTSPEYDYTVFLQLLIIGLILWVFGIYRIIRAKCGGYLKRLRKDIADAGYSENIAQYDFDESINGPLKASNLVCIGEKMFYFMDGVWPRALSTKKLLWAYQNGAPTEDIHQFRPYTISLLAEGRGATIEIKVFSHAQAQEALEEIKKRYPWVLIGFSAELKTMYYSNIEAFKEQWYYKKMRDGYYM